MKKFACILAAMMMMISAAMACECKIDPMMKMTAYQMAALDIARDEGELGALAAVFAGDVEDCTKTKTAILRLWIREYYNLQEYLSSDQVEALIVYLAHCGCCGEAEKDMQPAPVEQHVCRIERWVSDNSTNHHGVCRCGRTYKPERHVLGGVIRVENGLEVRRCSICGYEVYVYATHGGCGC